MKIAKMIARILSLLFRAWVSACTAVITYVPMSALAFSERGYEAVGGEIVPAVLVAIAVWHGLGWLTETLYKEYVAEIRLMRAAKKERKL